MNTRTNHGAIVPIERVEQLKPFTLPTPPPGMKWHREDGWTAEMLPPGKRPFFLGETSVKSNHDNPTDQVGGGKWAWGTLAKGEIATVDSKHLRTARPLLFIHSGHEWTWHRAGDPMPCNGDKMVVALTEYGTATAKASQWQWGDDQGKGNIIGWRYADAEKPDYNEPWSIQKGHLSTSLFDGEGVYFADIHELVCEDSSVAWAKAERIVACVNTCSKMADPAAEIAAMREAIREAGAALDDYDIVSAFAKLQPFITP